MSKNTLNTLLIFSVTLLLASHAGGVFAAETLGTLSTNSAPAGSPYNQLQFSVIDKTSANTGTTNELLPIAIKSTLIGGLAIEVIALIMISAVKRKRRYSVLGE